MPRIICDKLTIKFGKTIALNEVDLDIEGNHIVGLIGRAGSGKSALLSILAALKYPSSGLITVDGENPFENSTEAAKTHFTWENQKILKSGSIRRSLQFCAKLSQHYDSVYAYRLLNEFGLNLKMNIKKLRPEENAILNIVSGLASRAPITVFDETFLGLGYEFKHTFFRELIEDYKKFPRMIILSTDNANEIEPILSDVIIMDRGHAISHASPVEIKTVAQGIMNTQTMPSLQEVVLFFTKEGGGMIEQ